MHTLTHTCHNATNIALNMMRRDEMKQVYSPFKVIGYIKVIDPKEGRGEHFLYLYCV